MAKYTRVSEDGIFSTQDNSEYGGFGSGFLGPKSISVRYSPPQNTSGGFILADRNISITGNNNYYLEDYLDCSNGEIYHLHITFDGSNRSNFNILWSDRSSSSAYSAAFCFGMYHRSGFDGNTGYIEPKIYGINDNLPNMIVSKAMLDDQSTDTHVVIDMFVMVISFEFD